MDAEKPDSLNTPLHLSPIDASVEVWGFVVMPSNTLCGAAWDDTCNLVTGRKSNN